VRHDRAVYVSSSEEARCTPEGPSCDLTRLCRREPVTVVLYKLRFGVSLRSFRRDIANIRDAGIYLDADPAGDYRMLYFASDSDAS
jgi:hypothetical protein